MKKLLLLLSVLFVIYFTLANLTGWILVQTGQRLLPYRALYTFKPTLKWGELSLENVSIRVHKEIKINADHLVFHYSPEKILFANGIPLEINSRDLKITFEAGVAGFELPLECQFDTFEANLELKPGKHIDIHRVQGRGRQLIIQAQGWVNLRQNLVDMELKLVPQENIMKGLLANIQDQLFIQDNKQGAFIFKVSGSTAHPAVQFQTDLVKASFQ